MTADADTAGAGVADAGPSQEEVTSGFALGWQVAELYQPAMKVSRANGVNGLPRNLPVLAEWAPAERRTVRFDQIDAGLARLSERIDAAGLTAPTTKKLRRVSGDAVERGRNEVLAMHIGMSRVLTAADFRLGKAYALGRALFDTCHVEGEADLRQQLDPERLKELYSWSLDLKTVLPAHAGEVVYKSLQRWHDWQANPIVRGRSLDWARDGETVKAVLQRQGEIWRALLSGEKQATDTLSPADYVEAARLLFDHAIELLKRVPKRLWIPLVSVLAVAVVGLVLAIVLGRTADVVAALGGLAASLGINWAGFRHGLGEVAATLRRPLWGAELDAAIATAITRVDDLARADQA